MFVFIQNVHRKHIKIKLFLIFINNNSNISDKNKEQLNKHLVY